MSKPNEAAPAVTAGLTREDLIAIISEIRKPVKTEKELREEEQLEADRRSMMETLKIAERNRRQAQKDCSHKRRDGSTTSVYITDLNRLYCQKCAKWIIPTDEPDLFNELYQLAI